MTYRARPDVRALALTRLPSPASVDGLLGGDHHSYYCKSSVAEWRTRSLWWQLNVEAAIAAKLDAEVTCVSAEVRGLDRAKMAANQPPTLLHRSRPHQQYCAHGARDHGIGQDLQLGGQGALACEQAFARTLSSSSSWTAIGHADIKTLAKPIATTIKQQAVT